MGERISNRTKLTILLCLLLIACDVLAQHRTVDPTWLRRYVPDIEARNDPESSTCHYVSIFGEGDAQQRLMRSVARFGEVKIDGKGKCSTETREREEEIYFVLRGKAVVHYRDQTYSMRTNDFTYVAPGVKHSVENGSEQSVQVLLMSFRIPSSISLSAPQPEPKIVNLDDVKEETVEGHPTSVLYKLLAGPGTGKRDAIDQAYMVTSFFWMNFAPGGTNFPHHHEFAEEIYLLLDGEGEMVAGSGVDGIEGRYPAKPGDAYYFRPNCTVGFYNQDKPQAKAHILAVRSRIPLPENED
jgi:mannose-6-phosphate isomerase-like protein (cupin superfamily)